jgi:hypothetical protein
MEQLLITAYEKINKSQKETIEYKGRYELIKGMNIRIVDSARRILENKKISKSDMKIRLGIIVNNESIF